MFTIFYTFWFQPHRFFDNLETALEKHENRNTETLYINSLWFGSSTILLCCSYPVAICWHKSFKKFSLLFNLAAYFAVIITLVIFLAILYHYFSKQKLSHRKDGPGRIIFKYNHLFGHVFVICSILIVSLPLSFIIPFLETLFHSEAVEIVTTPIIVYTLRLIMYYFIAQAMHENNQKPVYED